MEIKVKIMISFLQKNFGNKFVSYFSVGVFVTLLDWIIFFIFYNILEINYLLVVSVSYLFSATNKFLLNKYLTFKNKSKKIFKQYLLFMVMVFFYWLLSLIFMYLLIDILLVEGFLSRVITTFILMFVGFLFDKYITYNNKIFN